MNTYKITEDKLEDKAVVAVGYKAIKYNGKTKQDAEKDCICSNMP